ncbi:hypothetical protein F441_18585 [Phytophthora nicotianae CJ01A1]|uniref:Uncharacterized protein n=1 Tax=Phytophthora nicotianae CJ01A1 TaxID=1317063 RepID=W2W2U4_PHYNI|nr:hypothetical protein F441_18585 [Phytophthora nicotianae CJ01A1]
MSMQTIRRCRYYAVSNCTTSKRDKSPLQHTNCAISRLASYYWLPRCCFACSLSKY